MTSGREEGPYAVLALQASAATTSRESDAMRMREVRVGMTGFVSMVTRRATGVAPLYGNDPLIRRAVTCAGQPAAACVDGFLHSR
jgi:hypothetical protein